MNRARSIAMLLVALGTLSAGAQERIAAGPPPNGPTFDVVSIKRVTEDRNRRSAGPQPGGRFVISGASIAPAIREAYPADSSDLINAPEWVLNEVYDLDARAAGTAEVSREQMRSMLQAMLADRFKLAVHYEMQDRPVYALRLARADGRLGQDLRRSELDCDAIQAARRVGAAGPFPATGNGAPACGTSMRAAEGLEVLIGGRPLSALAGMLAGAAGRVIVDKTGLAGNYEVTLRFLERPSDAPDAPPNLFTALQEQLGLKLEPDRAPLKILVIDRIEKPAEN